MSSSTLLAALPVLAVAGRPVDACERHRLWRRFCHTFRCCAERSDDAVDGGTDDGGDGGDADRTQSDADGVRWPDDGGDAGCCGAFVDVDTTAAELRSRSPSSDLLRASLFDAGQH